MMTKLLEMRLLHTLLLKQERVSNSRKFTKEKKIAEIQAVFLLTILWHSCRCPKKNKILTG